MSKPTIEQYDGSITVLMQCLQEQGFCIAALAPFSATKAQAICAVGMSLYQIADERGVPQNDLLHTLGYISQKERNREREAFFAEVAGAIAMNLEAADERQTSSGG